MRERERDGEPCVWASGTTMVIAVNLTTVKAVTACLYRPVYTAESRVPVGSQVLVSFSPSRRVVISSAIVRI